MNVRGNTVLITGGGSGIGLALARALLARGNTVLACGRSADRLDRARSELPDLQTFACDITDDRDRDRLCSWVRERFPSLDVLINNAGIARQIDFAADGSDGTAIELEVATNLLAPIHLTSGLLPMLRERPSAAIVNVTSALAYAPIASLPVYSATKAALRSFTRSLRRQLANTAVRVIEVVPAVVDTPMQRGLDVPKLDPSLLAERVLARMARGDQDIHVGQARAFRVGSRLVPEMLFGLLNRTVERSRTVSRLGEQAATEVPYARP